ncbi:hypothetical protein [Methylocystis parvus]|uniref:Uncharacterized protein n=1 Tax=Methylocystis parvus TaxID=134 RepID=A0A6B8M715_9HYPH|nr:hypothetical protein [Methylocystis parvus]QGM97802.1 hypothetical protein F7D14_10200 [Methylocystis parvus]
MIEHVTTADKIREQAQQIIHTAKLQIAHAESMLALADEIDGRRSPSIALRRWGEHLPTQSPSSLLGEHLKSAKQLAPLLNVSEKTAREIGAALGARRDLGGKVFFDTRVLTAHLSREILPNSSTAAPTRMRELQSADAVSARTKKDNGK